MGNYKGFSQVELRKPKRSMFDLSHEKRISSRMGKLTPVFVTETLPNDTFQVSTEVLIKLAPMIAPIFHRLNLYVHFFFVPMRLIWDERQWEQFITGGRLGPGVDIPPVPPRVKIRDILTLENNYLDVGSLHDYLGVPPFKDVDSGFFDDQYLDLRPSAAFFKIYMDYYRDRNYVADDIGGDPVLPLESGTLIDPAKQNLLFQDYYRCWEHDYFTSALPWTQRGSEVLMPLEGSGTPVYAAINQVHKADGSAFADDTLLGNGAAVDLQQGILMGGKTGATHTGQPAYIENIDHIDINASSVSINDLRRAVALQSWLERNALAGSRYTESIRAHFGRRTSDARLQRAEYLGGGKAVIQISEVMTTSYSEDGDSNLVPPAMPSGRGSTYSQTNGFRYNCEEHGFILGILSVMPTSGYMQGLPRMFQARNTFLDYPWPTFAHLGEQEVYKYEIYADQNTLPGDPNADWPLFGYQSRYSDWKYIPSSSHGDFRTNLDMWHLTRKFSEAPALGVDFVTFEDELQDRIFNVSGVDTLWMYVYNKVHAVRSIPYFGTPRLQ